MPTLDPVKNLEYVKKSQAKKKEEIGTIAYNKINAEVEQKHRNKLKSTIGEAEYKRQQAEYMKQYRANKKSSKSSKLEVEKKQKSSNVLSDAMKARKARNELLSLSIAKANKTEKELSDNGKKGKEIISEGRTLRKRINK
jgi:hypothetical protein